jgi:hypothetical protein
MEGVKSKECGAKSTPYYTIEIIFAFEVNILEET